MSLATLVLADGQASPVDHSFTMKSEFPIATWNERLGIAIGEPVVTIQALQPTAKRRSQKTTLRVTVPILETISGDAGGYTPAPRVAYTMWGETSFVCPDRSTLSQRKDLYAFMTNALAKAMFKAMVTDQAPAA